MCNDKSIWPADGTKCAKTYFCVTVLTCTWMSACECIRHTRCYGKLNKFTRVMVSRYWPRHEPYFSNYIDWTTMLQRDRMINIRPFYKEHCYDPLALTHFSVTPSRQRWWDVVNRLLVYGSTFAPLGYQPRGKRTCKSWWWPRGVCDSTFIKVPLVFIPTDRDVRKSLRDENMENTVGHKVEFYRGCRKCPILLSVAEWR